MLMLHSSSSAIIHSERKAAENILPLDSTLAICPIYRWLGCCLSSYFVSFMLKTWQIHNKSKSVVFHTQCFQGYTGKTEQDNIHSIQFPQDLEMWATLCVPFLLQNPDEQLSLFTKNECKFFETAWEILLYHCR